MTSITPKTKKIAWLQLIPNAAGHPDQEEAKARLATVAEITPNFVEIDSTNLERFDRDGIELVINTCTGEAFATQKGYARMSGLRKPTISKRCFQGIDQSSIKSAKIRTKKGVQKVNLIPAKLVFKWAIKDNPELAETMGEVGVTVYLHQLAGFKISLPTTEPREITSDQEGVWFGVVKRAEQLGYPVGLLVKKRASLGRWVSTRITDDVKETPFGKVYRVTNELNRAIVSYFDKLNVKL
jgi:hypothetical protein